MGADIAIGPAPHQTPGQLGLGLTMAARGVAAEHLHKESSVMVPRPKVSRFPSRHVAPSDVSSIPNGIVPRRMQNLLGGCHDDAAWKRVPGISCQ